MSTGGGGKGRGKRRGLARGKQTVATTATQPVTAGGAAEPPAAQPPIAAAQDIPDPRKEEEMSKQVVVAGSRFLRMHISGPDESIKSIAKRVDYGTVGQKFRVLANYFEMRIGGAEEQKVEVHQYEWDLSQSGPQRKLDRDERRALFWATVEQEQWPVENCVFDDSKTVYTVDKLPIDGTKEVEVKHQLRSDNRLWPYLFRIVYVGQHQINMEESVAEIHAERRSTSAQIIDAIVTQARRCPIDRREFIEFAKGFYPFGSNMFTMPKLEGGRSNAYYLGGGKELWTGFSTACKVGTNTNRPLMNIDAAVSVFYREMALLEFMCEVRNEIRESNQGRKLKTEEKYTVDNLRDEVLDEKTVLQLRRAFTGMRFRTFHLPDNNRDFKFVKMASNSFEFKFTQRVQGADVGQEVSVEEYFRQRYNALQYPHFPCVTLGSKHKPNVIPMECLMVYKPQKCVKKLPSLQQSDMIRECGKPAAERKKYILDMVKSSFHKKDPFMVKFQIEMKEYMKEVEARHLPKPKVLYQGGKAANISAGGWRTSGCKFLHPANVFVYGLINFSKCQNPLLQSMCQELVKESRNLGINWHQAADWPVYVPPDFADGRFNPTSSEFGDKLKQVFNDTKDRCCKNLVQKGMSEEEARNTMILVICVLDKKDADLYSRIKYYSEICEQAVVTERDQSYNLMTQCLLSNTADKIAKSVGKSVNATAANLAMKINMKMGGINNGLDADIAWRTFTRPDASKECTLFLGVDVTHPGPGDVRSPSIAGFVSNVDLEATRYASPVKLQKHRREHIVYMYDAVRERIVHFYSNTGYRPTRIIVYRDGVSDSQFIDVLREEMGSIRDACQRLDPQYKPKITYVVVQKRHHTRFFPEPGKAEGAAGNIPAGTVVDKTITHPFEYDFFLCSHGGGMGTSRPTHYYVLHDDNNIPVDELQLLTYQLTHVYGRCPKSVSIPAPCYFADLVCTRARAHLLGGGEVSSSSYGSQDETGRRGGAGDAESSDASSSLAGSDSASAEEMLANKVCVYWTVKQNMYFA